MRVNKWDKFYKIKDDDSIEILRLLRIKNSDCFVMVNDKKEKIKLTENELLKYTKLKPDGYVNFAAVSLDKGVKDVVISMFRRRDIEDGNSIPYCICRQNVFDLFANQLIKEGDPQYAGCSVSIETCPANTDYKMMMACDELFQTENISIYIDDPLENILYPVSLVNFDDILRENKKIATKSETRISGYCSKVKELLEQNHFIYDVLRAFNIYKVPFKTIYNEETNEIDIEQRHILEEMFKTEMFSTFVVKFTKEINLSKIERDHIIISDDSNDLWVVLYDKGEYTNVEYSRSVREIKDQVAYMKNIKR